MIGPLALLTLAGPEAVRAGELRGATTPAAQRTAAMAVADRVLPPAVRGRVVEGVLHRQFLPGETYWLGYRERARAAGRDLCERTAHSVQLSGGYGAAAATVLDAGAVETWREVAVVAPGTACGSAVGFVAARYQGERVVAAYRVLAAAMRAAARPGVLPFRISCDAETPEDCRDGRGALATLPMDALGGIAVGCVDQEQVVDRSRPGVALITCRPLRPGHPYKAEVAFGPSGEDGRSWRVGFVHHARWPAIMVLRRSTIIYH